MTEIIIIEESFLIRYAQKMLILEIDDSIYSNVTEEQLKNSLELGHIW